MRVIGALVPALVLFTVLSCAHSEIAGPVEVAVTVEGKAVRVGQAERPPHPSEHAQLSPKQTMEHDQTGLPRHDPVVPADGKSQAPLVVFQKELEVLEAMIELQTQKIQTLEKMRAALVEEAVVTGQQELGTSRRYRSQQPSRAELEEAVDRKLDALVAQVLAKESAKQFQSFFIDKVMVALDDDVVDIAMGKIKNVPTHDVVAVASRSGLVRVLLSSGPELLRIDTQLAGVRRVEVDSSTEPATLAVLAASGVRAFALHFGWESQSVDGPVSETRRSVDEMTLASTELLSGGTLPSLGSASVTAIAIARSARRSMLSIARSDGALGFYAFNGTLIHEVETGSANVSTLATHRHLVAFSNGTKTVVFPMTRQKVPNFYVCDGSLANVVSIAFDTTHPDVVYSGTVDGELLVFSLGGNPESGRSCKLLHRTITTRAPVQLEVIKGHVIAASSTEISIFAVSHADGMVSLTRSCSKQINLNSMEAPMTRFSVSENGHATILGVVVSSSGSSGTNSLVLMQSLLAGADSTIGESGVWRSASFLGTIAVVVLTAQFFLRRQNGPSNDDPVDSGKWRELLEKHGRGDLNPRGPIGRPTMASRTNDTHDSYAGDAAMLSATVDAFTKQSQRSKRAELNGGVESAEDVEYRRKIAKARRETLECSFDDVEDDEY